METLGRKADPAFELWGFLEEGTSKMKPEGTVRDCKDDIRILGYPTPFRQGKGDTLDLKVNEYMGIQAKCRGAMKRKFKCKLA